MSGESLERWEREYRKGFTKPLLLKMLSKGRSYPYKLVKTIEEVTEGSIKIATTNIYPTLRNLTDSGLVTKSEDEGSTRTYYELTTAGKAFLAEVERSVNDFVRLMDKTLLGDHSEES